MATETIGDRVRMKRESLGWNQSELARRCGGKVKPQNIQQLEDGTVSQPRYLARLAIALDTTERYLLTGNEDNDIAEPTAGYGTPIVSFKRRSDLPQDTYAFIRHLDARVSAGNGQVILKAPERNHPQPFPADWLAERGYSEESLFCIYADGDSMSPTFNDQASLLINKAETTIEDGRIYMIRFGSNVRVKRLFQRPDGGVTVHSDNPAYKPVEVPVDQMMHIAIIGRVVWQSGAV